MTDVSCKIGEEREPKVVLVGTAHRLVVAAVAAAALVALSTFLYRLAVGDVAWSCLLVAGIAALASFLAARELSSRRSSIQAVHATGPYELVERIGAGGMGEIWRARHRLLARPAAVKLIRTVGPVDGPTRERFALEARVSAELNSLHSIDIYDFGITNEGTFYLVMELLEGIDLEQLVEEFGPQPPERVVHIMLQVCDSLEEAHRKGLLHRDIKPSNIFLTTRAGHFDWVKLLDFGLVRTIGCDRERPTTPTRLVGTPAYLPPEVTTAACYGECHVDARADLYALAAVAFFLLTGRLVFEVESATAMAIAHALTPAEPPSRHVEQRIPPALDELILRTLAKNPDQRPTSAADLARELRALPLSPWSRERAREWWESNGPLHHADCANDIVRNSDVRPKEVLARTKACRGD